MGCCNSSTRNTLVKKINIIIFLLFFGMLPPLHGQTLGLQESIEKALTSHPDIKRFILQVNYSRKTVDVARADYLPQISLNGEYDPTRTYVLPTNGIFHTRDDDGWQIGATLRQKIWDFSRTTNLIKAGETEEEIAVLSLADAKALMAYRVKLQYELAAVQQQAIAVRKEDLQAKQELYRQAQALFRQGLKTEADATRFLSSCSVARDNLAVAEANLAKAKAMLSFYIGEPLPENVGFAAPASLPAGYPLTADEILRHSPVLKNLQKKTQQSDLLYRAAKAARFGSIDAMASYSHQDTLNSYDSTVAGILLTIPLYSGGRLSAQQEQAIINRQSAKNEYQSKMLALKEECDSLLIDLRRYTQTIRARTDQFRAAGKTKEVVDGRYREGLATYIEVLDATAAMLDARLGLLQAGYDKSSTIHRLEYLQGKIQ